MSYLDASEPNALSARSMSTCVFFHQTIDDRNISCPSCLLFQSGYWFAVAYAEFCPAKQPVFSRDNRLCEPHFCQSLTSGEPFDTDAFFFLKALSFQLLKMHLLVRERKTGSFLNLKTMLMNMRNDLGVATSQFHCKKRKVELVF